jgi:leader peptidase (prepilin peptidase)/N-methyltransferase
MIPLISGLMLKGKCQSCGAHIPGHLIRIELAATLAGMIAVSLRFGAVDMVLSATFLWVLVALFYCDLLYFRLPDPLTGALFVLGLGFALIDPARGVAQGLLSAGLASGVFLLIRWAYALLRGREGLGLGDVKVMAGIGAAVGWAEVPLVTLIAAVLALLVITLDSRRGKAPKGDAPVPFGSYLCAATGFVLMM